jgi:superoxide dismutase, Fe-Mn family
MFTLPPLPYAKDALAPYISAETLEFHHGKHHKKYIDTLNELLDGNPMADMGLEDIITRTHADDDPYAKKIFNNAAQAWNHDFLWKSMSPGGGGAPGPQLDATLTREIGSESAFHEQFRSAGMAQFGSGYVWLVEGETGLEVMATHDADLPMAHGKTALACCDLWEHAYYIDYRNDREKYLQAFLDHLINWDFVRANLDAVPTVVS